MAKFKGYTAEQKANIRIVNNLINRVNRLSDTFGHRSTEYQKGANILFDLGLAPTGGKFKPPTNKIISRMNLTQSQKRTAESVKNPTQLIRKKAGFGTITQAKRTSIISQIQSEFDIAQWIEHNIEAIYEYESKYGNVITGHSGKMSYDELSIIKNKIEESEIEPAGWGWVDDIPDE